MRFQPISTYKSVVQFRSVGGLQHRCVKILQTMLETWLRGCCRRVRRKHRANIVKKRLGIRYQIKDKGVAINKTGHAHCPFTDLDSLLFLNSVVFELNAAIFTSPSIFDIH